MPPIEKLLHLVALFNSRTFLTKQDIKSHCDIPERSLYRYLNMISELKIPFYYDYQKRGYVIQHQNDASLHLSTFDITLILFGLSIAQRKSEDSSLSKALEKIMNTFLNHWNSLFDLTKDKLNEWIDEKNTFESLQSKINFWHISQCAQNHWGCKVIMKKNEKNDTKVQQLLKPTIIFNNGWYVIDKSSTTANRDIKLENIDYILELRNT